MLQRSSAVSTRNTPIELPQHSKEIAQQDFSGQSGRRKCPKISNPCSITSRRSLRLFLSPSTLTAAMLSTLAFKSAAVFIARSQSRKCSNIQSLSSQALLLEIPTPDDMQDIGALLSINTGPSDTILMDGDLGAGKTCFSRGFVRARSSRSNERVTSPTYLLSNTYPTPDGLVIHHMDLYRLKGQEDLGPLNIDHVLMHCISLIEWPSRLGNMVPQTRLDVTFSFKEELVVDGDGDEGNDALTRILKLEPHGLQWEQRLDFLVQEGLLDDLLLV